MIKMFCAWQLSFVFLRRQKKAVSYCQDRTRNGFRTLLLNPLASDNNLDLTTSHVNADF